MSSRVNDRWGGGKLLAAMGMAANHVWLVLPSPWPFWGYVFSRFCAPVFAFLLISRLLSAADFSGAFWRLFRRLVIWGAVTQPFYMYYNKDFGFSFNILWVFALGSWLIYAYRFYGVKSFAFVLPFLSCFFLYRWLEFSGLLPVSMFLCSFFAGVAYRDLIFIVFMSLACALGQYSFAPFGLLFVASFASLPILAISYCFDFVFAEFVFPRSFFYVFYPFTYALALSVRWFLV